MNTATPVSAMPLIHSSHASTPVGSNFDLSATQAVPVTTSIAGGSTLVDTAVSASEPSRPGTKYTYEPPREVRDHTDSGARLAHAPTLDEVPPAYSQA